jgi:hypothetical protein
MKKQRLELRESKASKICKVYYQKKERHTTRRGVIFVHQHKVALKYLI